MNSYLPHEAPRQRDASLQMTRRQLMGRAALGLGTASMAQLLGPDLLAEQTTSSEGLHHAAKAKHVIYLFMSGGPSQLDLWDYKPKLKEMAGKQLPDHIRDGQRVTGMTAVRAENTAGVPQQIQVHQAEQQPERRVGQRTFTPYRNRGGRNLRCQFDVYRGDQP